jgi:tetratricopeptide (TPR) repeat protein
MDNETKPKTDLLQLVAWADANRKRLITVAVVILALAAIIGIYVWHGNAREASANEALSQLPMPGSGPATDAAKVAGQYAQVADMYADTSAGARAMLIGGAMYFDAGQPAKAQPLFERYLHEHADYPLTGQALIGLAASLEAQGKAADAINRYEELLRTHGTDPAALQAKAALANLYAAGNKPDRALQLYEQLIAMNSSWAAEAQIQAQELLGNNPSLRQPPPAPPAAPGPAATPTTNEALIIPGTGH